MVKVTKIVKETEHTPPPLDRDHDSEDLEDLDDDGD